MGPFLDITVLFEEYWTGVSTVVAALASCALKDKDLEWCFFRDLIPIPRSVVTDMLKVHTGTEATKWFNQNIWHLKPIDYQISKNTVGVFTTIKSARNVFRNEAVVVYDLTPVLTPQFHDSATIEYYGNRLRLDVESSQRVFAISDAVFGDLRRYFGIQQDKCSVLPMGVTFADTHLSLALDIASTRTVEPYVLVLGTLEPRKNGRLVLDFLARNPSFLDRFKVVFVGKQGWLNEQERLRRALADSEVSNGRVLFTGFISEKKKISLLYNSAFCIYPSFFEGYGLPILEASLLGKYVVTSNNTSMPEVAPHACLFFDPSNMAEFSLAMTDAEELFSMVKGREGRSFDEIRLQAARYDWNNAYEEIKKWVLQ